MPIFVCVKHVPDTAAKITIQNGTQIDESVKFVINPYDEFAIEEALLLKEKQGGEVVIVTLGKAAAVNTMRTALAMGADRGILIQTTEDTCALTTAHAIATAIKNDGTPDMVFLGKQSVDAEGMQTAYFLGNLLNLPVASNVISFQKTGTLSTVECEIESGARQVCEIQGAGIIAATKGLNQPRYPKLPDIMKAKKKEVKEIPIASLNISCAKIKLNELKTPPEKGAGKIWKTGSVAQNIKELVSELHNTARVL